MPATVFASYLVAAFFLTAELPRESPRPYQSPGPKLVRVTYPVADLVVPIGQPSHPALGAAGARPRKTAAARLMALIRNTVAPGSWGDHGGPGVMKYQATGLGLVVVQTQDVQEQIQDLLAALPRLQDLEVAVEVRLLTVSDSFFEQTVMANARPSDPTGMAFLDDSQLRSLFQAAQGDRRTTTMQTPRFTVFNGQEASLDLTRQQSFVTDLKVVREGDQVVVVPKTEVIRTGLRFSARPVVSADRRYVAMNLHATLSDLESPQIPVVPVITHLVTKTDPDGREHIVPVQQFVQQPAVTTLTVGKSFAVADGKTAVLRWGTRATTTLREADSGPPVLSKIPYINRLVRNVGYGQENETVLLLITPRIIVNAEEEQEPTPPRQTWPR
jgi:general secretion pathway protein D